MTPRPRLDRAHAGIRPADPVRIVHFGPGAFFRAHQAWYTGRTPGWGIAAVTQRSDDMVGRLAGQGGAYTVLTRGPEADSTEVVGSISEAIGHQDARAIELIADPDITVVTLTITEAGYRPGSAALGRLIKGLEARRPKDVPISIVSCDNLSGNSTLLKQRLVDAAGPELGEWISQTCGFPETVVDRITPATTPTDTERVAELTGFDDESAVVTEPWSEWIIQDAFVAERPRWEDAGASVVPDVTPFEHRKLRLLNGGHSLLAYVGSQFGHTLVHQAMGDPTAHAALLGLWGEARLGLSEASLATVEDYCAGVEKRWTNPRLPHRLEQIGSDGSLKLKERIVPTVLAARAAGAEPTSAALALGGWVAHVRGHGAIKLTDRRADELVAAGAGPLPDAVVALLNLLDPRIAEDGWVRRAVTEAAARFEE